MLMETDVSSIPDTSIFASGFCLFILDKISVGSSGSSPVTHCVDQVDSTLTEISLPQPPKCQD